MTAGVATPSVEEQPPGEGAATAAAEMSCQACGATLLWAAELCGFCVEEREAMSTTTTEGEDG